MIVASTRPGALQAGAEHRLAGFTELVATAIANAEGQAALAASRARIVATADQTRRRIERDLHDGAQQRLVTLALHLRVAQAAALPAAGEVGAQLARAVAEANGALEDLRETARGIHPAILAKGGLRTALKTLARRSPVPVDLRIAATGAAARAGRGQRLLRRLRGTDQRDQARPRLIRQRRYRGHRRASCGSRSATTAVGGADFSGGTGLVGLKDRMEATGRPDPRPQPAGRGRDTTLPWSFHSPPRDGGSVPATFAPMPGPRPILASAASVAQPTPDAACRLRITASRYQGRVPAVTTLPRRCDREKWQAGRERPGNQEVGMECAGWLAREAS